MRFSNATRSVKPYIVGNLYFTFGTSFVAGASNYVASILRTNASAVESAVDFFHAFGGNLGFGVFINFIPATFNHRFARHRYFWLTGNLMMLGMNALMLGFHFLIQTENPIESRVIPTLVSQLLENILIVREHRNRSVS
jgi:hypothetical protein